MINQINGCLQNESTAMNQFLDKMQNKFNHMKNTDLKGVNCLQKGNYKVRFSQYKKFQKNCV